MDGATEEPTAMTDAAEAPDGAIRRPGPATIDPAEAEAEQSDGYVESDEDGGSSIDEEPDSPNAESAADLQPVSYTHLTLPTKA